MYNAKILLDSVTPRGHRLTTMQVTFPRFILAEFNTHRVFSRNSASSRAIPVEDNIKRVLANPFVPEVFTKNQKGMQAKETVDEVANRHATSHWRLALDGCVKAARELVLGGVHKQHANRLIELWGWHTVIVTSTEWQNFWGLRDSTEAQPEMEITAKAMRAAYDLSEPEKVSEGYWHLPLVYTKGGNLFHPEDLDEALLLEEKEGKHWIETLTRVSIARCARVSILTRDGLRAIKDDLRLAADLQRKGHMSPFEHAARPMDQEELGLFAQPVRAWEDNRWQITGKVNHFLGNVQGWVQARKMITNEDNFASLTQGT